MKKYSLVKSFTLFSLITFTLTGIVLSFVISEHIRADNYKNLIGVTQLTIDSITENILVVTDFNDIITGSKKNNIEENIKKSMSIYMPKSIVLYNSRKEVVINSKLSADVLSNINQDTVDEILSSNIPFYISEVYNVIEPGNTSGEGENLTFDIYVPVKYQNKTVGALILQIPEVVISSHVNMLLKEVVLSLSGGLLILFLLLIRILNSASKTLLKQNSELVEQKIEIETAYKKLSNSYKNTVFALSNAVDARDSYTAGHSERVTSISMQIGRKIKLPEEDLKRLEYAALFHDIGKIGIPDYILLKNGKLTDEEFDIIKKHPEMGVNILMTIDFLADVLPIIKHHHEKFIGKGYPDNINGDDIPLGARIIAIADTYDAMTTDRPYRKRLSHETAVEEILRNKGLQFDDKLVDVFMEIEDSIK